MNPLSNVLKNDNQDLEITKAVLETLITICTHTEKEDETATNFTEEFIKVARIVE